VGADELIPLLIVASPRHAGYDNPATALLPGRGVSPR
jgi:hypothetical protein